MYRPSDKPNTRIDVADILRGIAIGGIILIHFIEQLNFYVFPEPSSPFWGAVNQGVWDTVFFLLAGKMYAIFAMLFGLSFFIQHDNQAQKGVDFRLRFLWRMVLLFMFGLFDLMFFNGDILDTFKATVATETSIQGNGEYTTTIYNVDGQVFVILNTWELVDLSGDANLGEHYIAVVNSALN